MMKISLLKNEHYIQMPWKNGKGFTSEIAIFPQGTTVKENNFTWRLSTAEMIENGPFSNYPGYDRFLTVIAGDGLILHRLYESHVVDQDTYLQFDGEENIQGELVNGKIKDLNLFLKKGAHKIDFKICHSNMIIHLIEGTHFIFVTKGIVHVENLTARLFETVMIEIEPNTEMSSAIRPEENSQFVWITIS